MARGLSPKEYYGRQRRGLLAISRLLSKAGIASHYQNYHLVGNRFNARYRRVNASNGETAMLFEVVIDGRLQENTWFRNPVQIIREGLSHDDYTGQGNTGKSS